MTPENPPTTSSKPPCLGVKKDGSVCNAPPTEDGYCVMHGPKADEIRARARQASNEARKAKVERREQALEDADLSLTAHIRITAGRRNKELAEALVSSAITDPHGRAMAHVLDRVEGKVANEVNVNAGDPFAMSESELHRWLESTTVPTEGADEAKTSL